MTSPDRAPIVILSPEPWHTLAPTNKHQLATQFSSTSDVLYINVRGRSPRDGTWPPLHLRRDPSGVLVCDIVGLPQRMQHRWRCVAALQDWLAITAVRTTARRRGWHRVVAISYFPFAFRAVQRLGADVLVYHCVDHHASFPVWATQREALLRTEERLVVRADAVVASSRALEAHCRRWRTDILLLENVADVSLFGQVATRRREAPDHERNTDVACRSHPVGFFHGTFSAHKTDFPLLATLVDATPDFIWRFLGSAADPSAAAAMARLAQRPNVEWLSARRQDEVVVALAQSDVLLLPYARNEHTEHVFPLKLIEYLATGRPILSTPLACIQDYCGDALAYATTASEAVPALARLLQEAPEAADRRRALAHGRTWERRAEELLAVLHADSP